MVRMAKYGVTSHELERYIAALIKDAHQDAESQDTMTSSSLIEDLVDDTLLGNTLLSPIDDYELILRLAPTISLAEVNHLARQTFRQTLRIAQILQGDDSFVEENGSAAEEEEGFASSLKMIENSRGLSVFVTCPTVYSPDGHLTLQGTNLVHTAILVY